MNTFTKLAEEWVRKNRPYASIQPQPTSPALDPSPWAEDFHKWTLARCVYRDRCFGGISSLHRDFCEWVIAHDECPCTREAFVRLLDQCGFLFVDDFVSGLLLGDDLQGLKGWPNISHILGSGKP